ncbi:MAG: S8 family peptidase [Chloroflexota bacterium]|nr:S8 family peptidase [Thermodesulfobacteriota bacterium]MDY6873018.1 S8 family peptidase [Chloroflexota bacterium]
MRQLTELEDKFDRYKASVSSAVAGLEPETVLVIEIAGSVDEFKQAIDATEGLEWLGEWDVEDIEPDDDFYEPPKIGVTFFKKRIDHVDRNQSLKIRDLLREQEFIDKDGHLIVDDLKGLSLPDDLEGFREDITKAVYDARQKLLAGKLFVSMGNQQGINELLRLWQIWERGASLPQGKAKWRDVFAQALHIRRWGIEETLYETGMVDRWRDLVEPVNPDQEVHCQIELFYRGRSNKRRETETAIRALLGEINGAELSAFLDMKEIAFHAVKVSLPAGQVRNLLEALDAGEDELDIQLFKFPGIMYFRPTGQSLVILDNGPGVEVEFPQGAPELPPVAAILDGAPNLQHDALRGRLSFDDPDNLLAQYQPGERKHGTAMASLVVHGALDDDGNHPLSSQVYCLPVMQPNPGARDREEHFPDEVFFEDRIERAVRRMKEGEGGAPAQAPSVSIINLSIGDPERPFIHTPSPWARLLDWLAWKYRVLFCVSAGNYRDAIDVGIPNNEFAALADDQKIEHVLKCIERQLSHRRLLSPAESLNALTIGAMHKDASGNYEPSQRIDLLPDAALFSPVCRFGHGFRRSVKPEVLFPGGKQLFRVPPLDKDQIIFPDTGVRAPGQQVAWDSAQEGEASKTVFTRGTSNATALATRNAVKIYDVLAGLKQEHDEQIPDELMSVLVKALLVHGAHHEDRTKDFLSKALKNSNNSRRFKEVIARYIGYGSVNIERVLACTEQRATVLGAGEIHENEVHEYRFPLPPGLSGRSDRRRMVVTLAWFTPINPAHRNLREAKLTFHPGEKWNDLPLKLERVDADHNQVARGTVQHEVLEGRRQISAYEDDGHILLHVTCKPDATESLDDAIPYGLAVTLEVAEEVDVPIYEQVRARIRPAIPVGAGGGIR